LNNISLDIVMIASLQDLASNCTLEVPVGCKVSDAIAKFSKAQAIDLEPLLAEIQLVSLNHQRVHLDQEILEPGELALMPPITGG